MDFITRKEFQELQDRVSNVEGILLEPSKEEKCEESTEPGDRVADGPLGNPR